MYTGVTDLAGTMFGGISSEVQNQHTRLGRRGELGNVAPELPCLEWMMF